MDKIYRRGAIGALLDEYEKAVIELQAILTGIPDIELIKIADSVTTDVNCRSIQSVLSHVVRSMYSYAIYIRNMEKDKMDRPETTFHLSVKDYQKDLNVAFIFTEDTFRNIDDGQLEQLDNSKKMLTSWGQVYDIEQIMEHAIVHILRHRRQIEKFRLAFSEKN